jgi:NTE family protein
MTTKKALVLSGGSVKGAFQAGAIKALIEKGYTFDKIYGISVGSLNGTFMCNEAGKQVAFGNKIDWKYIGDHLVDF